MLDAENPFEPGAPSQEPASETPQDTAQDTAPTAAESDPGAATDVPAKKAAAKKTAKKAPAKKAAAKKATPRRTTKKVAAPADQPSDATVAEPVAPDAAPEAAAPEAADPEKPAAKKTAKKAAKKPPAKRTTKKVASAPPAEAAQSPGDDEILPGLVPAQDAAAEGEQEQSAAAAGEPTKGAAAKGAEEEPAAAAPAGATALLFQPPDPTKAVVTRKRKSTKPQDSEPAAGSDEGEGNRSPKKPAKGKSGEGKSGEGKSGEDGKQDKPSGQDSQQADDKSGQQPGQQSGGDSEDGDEQGGGGRRRRRGGRRRRRSGGGENDSQDNQDSQGSDGSDQDGSGPRDKADSDDSEESGGTSRRRRRRRRSGESSDGSGDEPDNTVTKVRKPRSAEDEITAVTGSTRLEAKKQRRREGREAGRRRAPIVSEAEFLARRESVDRVMVIRQRQDLTQIAVMEDKVLVEHYVSRESQTSLIGNVYVGRVQNVLPSMEAAFIDIGKGRNAVLYAGEVNWDALGAKNGQPRKIEAVLKSGQPILVQVTKDPIGHKGARLTSQISLPGRFLVYVPDGTTSGISRKLPDTERNRLKTLLKEIVPDSAGVIVRTAAEGASEEELTRDVERLTARWQDIEKKSSSGNAPQLLYGEPDLTLKVVRDLFTEDFNKLVIAGDDAWDMVEGYVSHVAPDLADRLERYDGERDVFSAYRIDEQIEKALDRKVWLPSGGSLVIDRTEAMTVVDVNTGKFTGSGGNLEETVTKNNLEAAEEIVRQLRLRDIGGIIVVDFIDMVLESNRDLVLRRMVECLGRDRTRHQVAEVTSLGLVQMTRKRIGTGLLEAFSENCEHCQGRGLVLHHEPIEPKKKGGEDESRRSRRGRGRGGDSQGDSNGGGGVPSPKEVAAMAKHDDKPDGADQPEGKQKDAEAASATPDGAKPAEAASSSGAKGESVAPSHDGSDQAAVGASKDDEDQGEPKRSGRSRGGRGRGGRGRGGQESQDQAETGSAQESGGSAPGASADQSEKTGTEKTGDGQTGTETGTPQPAAETPATSVSEPANAGEPGETPEAPKGGQETSATAPSEPEAPAAPTVVTTVRRRSARRAAGPPAGGGVAVAVSAAESSASQTASGQQSPGEGAASAGVDGVADAAADGAAVDADADESASTPHVPVKKRGSRRR